MEIRQRHWLISVKLEDLWVSLCPIKKFDLYAVVVDGQLNEGLVANECLKAEFRSGKSAPNLIRAFQ